MSFVSKAAAQLGMSCTSGRPAPNIKEKKVGWVEGEADIMCAGTVPNEGRRRKKEKEAEKEAEHMTRIHLSGINSSLSSVLPSLAPPFTVNTLIYHSYSTFKMCKGREFRMCQQLPNLQKEGSLHTIHDYADLQVGIGSSQLKSEQHVVNSLS